MRLPDANFAVWAAGRPRGASRSDLTGLATVTATGVSRREQRVSADRSWHLTFLAKTEPGRRNRRTIDSVVLAFAAVLLGLSAAIASSAPSQDQDVADALRTVF